ncbi:DUF3298 domain-containing protein [Bordetella pertussis]|uniref:RsiV family protein n=1 Tax=Bordetella pertussis TaxID=520 RepID=UPI000F5D10C3|nr:RsiV family protein [Bordetella pertussis]AZH02515.1 DUF3298 domain-containing protein [Bordetella pertussis]
MKYRATALPRPRLKLLCAAGALALLAACGSAPPADITLAGAAPAAAGAEPATIGDVRTERIQWASAKPGCTGECPRVEIDSVSFPGIPALSELVDRQLAAMTGVDQNLRGRYQTLSEYTQYFWKTAQARDATYFKASVKDVVGDIVAVELGTTQFLTGAAHGIPATHYLNWQRSQGRPLTLDEVLIPSRKAEYVVAMREAHQRWLAANEDAQHDRAAYDRMWPFQETTNFALTRQGLVVKYDAYTIAPYSHGQPEILIPYERLRGVLRPEFIPAG